MPSLGQIGDKGAVGIAVPLAVGLGTGLLVALGGKKWLELKAKIYVPAAVVTSLSSVGLTFFLLPSKTGGRTRKAWAKAHPPQPEPVKERAPSLREKVEEGGPISEDLKLQKELLGLPVDKKIEVIGGAPKAKRQEILWLLFDKWRLAPETAEEQAGCIRQYVHRSSEGVNAFLKRPDGTAIQRSEVKGLAKLFAKDAAACQYFLNELNDAKQQEPFLQAAVKGRLDVLGGLKDKAVRQQLLWMHVDAWVVAEQKDRAEAVRRLCHHVRDNTSDLSLLLSRPAGAPLEALDVENVTLVLSHQAKLVQSPEALSFFFELEDGPLKQDFVSKIFEKGPLLDDLIPWIVGKGTRERIVADLRTVRNRTDVSVVERGAFAVKVVKQINDRDTLFAIGGIVGLCSDAALEQLAKQPLPEDFDATLISDGYRAALAKHNLEGLAARVPLGQALLEWAKVDPSNSSSWEPIVRCHLGKSKELQATLSDVQDSSFTLWSRVSAILFTFECKRNGHHPSLQDLMAVPPVLEALSDQLKEGSSAAISLDLIRKGRAHEVIADAITRGQIYLAGRSSATIPASQLCTPAYEQFMKTAFPDWESGWQTDPKKCAFAEQACDLALVLRTATTRAPADVLQKIQECKGLPPGVFVRTLTEWGHRHALTNSCMTMMHKQLEKRRYFIPLMESLLSKEKVSASDLYSALDGIKREDLAWDLVLRKASSGQLVGFWYSLLQNNFRPSLPPASRVREVLAKLKIRSGEEGQLASICKAIEKSWVSESYEPAALALSPTALRQLAREQGKQEGHWLFILATALEKPKQRQELLQQLPADAAALRLMVTHESDRALLETGLTKLLTGNASEKGEYETKRLFALLGKLLQKPASAKPVEGHLKRLVQSNLSKQADSNLRLQWCLQGWCDALKEGHLDDGKPDAQVRREKWGRELMKAVRAVPTEFPTSKGKATG